MEKTITMSLGEYEHWKRECEKFYNSEYKIENEILKFVIKLINNPIFRETYNNDVITIYNSVDSVRNIDDLRYETKTIYCKIHIKDYKVVKIVYEGNKEIIF